MRIPSKRNVTAAIKAGVQGLEDIFTEERQIEWAKDSLVKTLWKKNMPRQKRLRTTNRLIRIRFPDGIYQFWEASQDKNDMRVVFRVKETGKGGSRTPEERMANLVKEMCAIDPETATRIPQWHRYRPADMGMVVRWCAGHGTDLYDLLDSIALRPKK